MGTRTDCSIYFLLAARVNIRTTHLFRSAPDVTRNLTDEIMSSRCEAIGCDGERGPGVAVDRRDLKVKDTITTRRKKSRPPLPSRSSKRQRITSRSRCRRYKTLIERMKTLTEFAVDRISPTTDISNIFYSPAKNMPKRVGRT